MLCGPKGFEQRSRLQCGICGRYSELFELHGRTDRLCLSCGADLAISEQLTIEIDAAALSGRERTTWWPNSLSSARGSSNERNPSRLQITEPPEVAPTLF